MVYAGPVIVSTAYFPPVQYFSKIVPAQRTILELHENYSKQSYRNRCNILSSTGVQTLSVPVQRGSFHKVALRDLKIEYSKPWQQIHLRSLKTAYSSSAFYEYMKDDVESCILKGHTYLLDLNLSILEMLNTTLELGLNIEFSSEYLAYYPGALDLRDIIHPKREENDAVRNTQSYFQVFSKDNSFVPGLSILDLMFNMGLESLTYLKSFTQE
jgi:hypothetical protein